MSPGGWPNPAAKGSVSFSGRRRLKIILAIRANHGWIISVSIPSAFAMLHFTVSVGCLVNFNQ
jgi:hypothetical protein